MTTPLPVAEGSILSMPTSAARNRRLDQDAEGLFQGLPDGMTRWQLAGSLRGAARRLGLSTSMLALLELYIDLTYDLDWMEGSEPVIGRPLLEIAERLGRSERQVRNLERNLADRGLLAWRDSANRQRTTRRDRTGRIVYAYGPSLAPLGRRASEVARLAAEERREIAAIRTARIAIAALRRKIRDRMALLENHPAAQSAQTLLEMLPRRHPAGTPLTKLEAERAQLAAAAAALTGRGDDNPIGGTSASTAKQKAARMAAIHSRPDTTRQSMKAINGVPHGLGIGRLSCSTIRDLAGPMMQAAGAGNDWKSIIDAGRAAALSLGITQNGWAEAVQLMGRQEAAISIMILEHHLARTDRTPIRRPDAYLSGMAHRGRRGELNLTVSLQAIARRNRSAGIPQCRQRLSPLQESVPS